MQRNDSSIGEIVRKAERNYLRGTTKISDYVDFDMHETIEKIEAYLNSRYTSGQTDALGRDKPFFNIVIAAANIWERATDIDRKHIRIMADKSQDVLTSFIATVLLRRWMRKANFGIYLNKWGRTLARFGSAITKIIKSKSGLSINIIPWTRMIVDSVDFYPNPKIEILELTEEQLRANPQYDKQTIEDIINANKSRETINKRRKDNKSDYYKLYEVHGKFSQAVYKESKGKEVKDGDKNIFFQQMIVLSYVGVKENGKQVKKDFILYAGKEDRDPYKKDDLIEEDSRTLSIGAVEHLFESQWMHNHLARTFKDNLDIASKIVLQTADAKFLGRNILTSVENGQIMIHDPNKPLNLVNNQAINTGSLQAYWGEWRRNRNEIVSISESMLGAEPKSGTAWRQTEALLQESHSLFEKMIENKGLALEDTFRNYGILEYIQSGMDTIIEVAAELEAHEIEFIDRMFVPKEAVRQFNKRTAKKLLNEMEAFADGRPTNALEQFNPRIEEQRVKNGLVRQGSQRFLKPSDITKKTWSQVIKNLDWNNIVVDVSGEDVNTREALATLNTALKVMITPGFDQNEKAQAVVGRILELSGGVSPIEFANMMAKPGAPVQPGAEDLAFNTGR